PAGGFPVSGVLMSIEVGWSRNAVTRSLAAFASAPPPASDAADAAGATVEFDDDVSLFLSLPHAANNSSRVAESAINARGVRGLMLGSLSWGRDVMVGGRVDGWFGRRASVDALWQGFALAAAGGCGGCGGSDGVEPLAATQNGDP